MAIKGILFDKDGTLIDVNNTWLPIYRIILQEQFNTDLAGAEELMQRVGYDPVNNRMRAGSIIAAGTTQQLVDVWWDGASEAVRREKVRVLDHDYVDLVASKLSPLVPLSPIMSELRAMGFELGVATNDSIASARRHLDQMGIADQMAAIIAADTVPRAKPSGDMIRSFAATTGLQPAEIAMVGDNAHDLEEANNGGAGLSVAVLTGNAGPDDVAHLADHVLPSVADLAALLRSL